MHICGGDMNWCYRVTVHFDLMQKCIVFTLHPHLINDIKIIPGPTFALDPEWHVYETLHQNNIPSLLHLTFIAASSVVSLWSSNLEARHIKDQIEKKQEKTFEFFQNKSNQPSEGKFIVFVCVCDHGGNVEC